jgi:hypothetical protein
VGEKDERGGERQELISNSSSTVVLVLNKVQTLFRRFTGWLDSDASFLWWIPSLL